MIDYGLILSTHYSDSEWVLEGDSYEGLTWLSSTGKPSKRTLDGLWPSTSQAAKRAEVQEKRRRAYQEESDPLFFEWQRGEATEAQWRAAVAAVEARFPY